MSVLPVNIQNMVATRSRGPRKALTDSGGRADGSMAICGDANDEGCNIANQSEIGVVVEVAADGEEDGGPDSFQRLPELRQILARLQVHVSDPTVLLQPNNELSAAARLSAQVSHAHVWC